MPLWKRCRILANPLRLEMLACLDQNEPKCVMGIAAETGVSEDVSSKNLQFLELGGFLKQKRSGKYLFYSLDRSNGLLQGVLDEMHDGRIDAGDIMHILTALTHERRISIVAALANGPQELGRLGRRTEISRLAMERQVDKLVRRNFVANHEGECRLLSPKNRLASLLIHLAVESVTLAQV